MWKDDVDVLNTIVFVVYVLKDDIYSHSPFNKIILGSVNKIHQKDYVASYTKDCILKKEPTTNGLLYIFLILFF